MSVSPGEEYGPSERKVLEILALLPTDSFVRNYVSTVAGFSDTHVGHHLAGALAVLSQLVPMDVHFPFGANPIYANVFGLLVGSSGSRKTVAVKVANATLHAAGVPTCGPTPASREAFIDSLTEHPKRILTYTEFGDFLATSSNGSYLAPLRTAMNDAADCAPLLRERVRRRRASADEGDEGGETGAMNPRVTVLGAVAQPFLDAHTDSNDWGGGFFARFFTTAFERERLIPLPEDGSGAIEQIGRWVGEHYTAWCGAEAPVFGRCAGFTPEAREAYTTWAHKMDVPAAASVAVGAATNRLGPLAVKLATLLAWENMAPRNGEFRGIAYVPVTSPETPAPWLVDTMSLAVAMKLVEEIHYKSVLSVAGGLAPTREERAVVAVTRSLDFADKLGKGLTVGELSADLRFSPKQVQDALATMKVRGHVRERQRFDQAAMEFVLIGGRVATVISLDAAREARRIFGE